MGRYDDFQHLNVEVASEIATVVFNPQVEGDIVDSFFTNLRDVFSPLSLDHDVRAVVLTGSGDVFFDGVGRERSERLLASGLENVADQLLTLQQIVSSMVSFRKPLVAAVNGKAHNIGCQIALLCDAAVAASEPRSATTMSSAAWRPATAGRCSGHC